MQANILSPEEDKLRKRLITAVREFDGKASDCLSALMTIVAMVIMDAPEKDHAKICKGISQALPKVIAFAKTIDFDASTETQQ